MLGSAKIHGKQFNRISRLIWQLVKAEIVEAPISQSTIPVNQTIEIKKHDVCENLPNSTWFIEQASRIGENTKILPF